MNSAYILLGFAVVFLAVSVGLQTRALWCWYAGFAFAFLVAAYRGSVFFEVADRPGSTDAQIGYAACWLAGSMLIWLPVMVWWAKQREKFGKQARRKSKKPPTFTNLNEPDSGK